MSSTPSFKTRGRRQMKAINRLNPNSNSGEKLNTLSKRATISSGGRIKKYGNKRDGAALNKACFLSHEVYV